MSPTETQDIKYIEISHDNEKIKVDFNREKLKELFQVFIGLANCESYKDIDINCSMGMELALMKSPNNNDSIILYIKNSKGEIVSQFTYAKHLNYEPCVTLDNDKYTDTEYLVDIIKNGFDKSFYGKINKKLNEIYNHIKQKIAEQSRIETKNSNQKKPLPTQQTVPTVSPQEIAITQQVVPVSPVSINELSFREFTEKHLEYHIHADLREIVNKYGQARSNKKLNDFRKREVELKTKLGDVVLRKTKTRSVFRLNKRDSTKFVLKIGTGDFLNTSQRNFEWRVDNNEENIQHIKDAFVELNKWYKEKKEINVKEKLDEENKKKEAELKKVELLKQNNFKPLE